MEFTGDNNYTRYDVQGDQLWNDLVPLGTGYVLVERPSLFNLPPSISPSNHSNTSTGTMVYQASVMHQMHCMATFRDYVKQAELDGDSVHDRHGHITHCINYLRQAIMCTADLTLEHGTEFFSGEGVLHQCRDWESVMRYLQDHRAIDEKRDILHT